MNRTSPAAPDAWSAWRAHTRARIGLGRAGGSLPTGPWLEFQAAHARARDAVHRTYDADGLVARFRSLEFEALRVGSAAPDRLVYLKRPDLGRRLDAPSRHALALVHARRTDELSRGSSAGTESPFDIAFVVADGLSSLAPETHAPPVLSAVRPVLIARGWRIAPIVVAVQARVAIGDEIGALLAAAHVAVLIGERPGLSSADSLGVYLTRAPRVGRTDAERNCISNIRPVGGLGYDAAAHTLLWLMLESQRRGATGVALKDESRSSPSLLASPSERDDRDARR